MNPIIKMTLNDKTTMRFELYEDKAPISVKNFVELVKSGFYTNCIFHRVIASFMVQAGGYFIRNNQIVYDGSAKNITGEFEANGIKNDIKHEFGVLSMARSQNMNSASSQFFICVDNCQHLDKNYAAFGKMIEGEGILKKLCNEPTTYVNAALADFPRRLLVIESMTVEE